MKLEFKYTNELVNYLIKIEKYKTALDYLFLPTRERKKLMYEAKLKKTHFSTSIEGNVLSYNQVEKVIASKNDFKRLTADQEVQNYWDALTFLEEENDKNTKIDKEFIFKLHDIIQRQGKLIRIPLRGQKPPGILFTVYDSVTKAAEYIPPEYNDIEPLMDELINWYYNNQNLPAPILSAIMHYALVTIHPFTDGNGRTSRALATELGAVCFAKTKNYVIANCFSQRNDFRTDYEALGKCLDKVVAYLKSHNLDSVAIPYKYGCGIASGNWEIVKETFVKKLVGYTLKIYKLNL